MTPKQFLKQFLEKHFDCYIYSYQNLPRGTNFYHDQKKFFPKLHINLIFDVGANVGQFAINFNKRFPDAKIYCFEPGEIAFAKLQKEVQQYYGLVCVKAALGAAKSTATFVNEVSSELSHLSKLPEKKSAVDGRVFEDVMIETIDGFSAQQGICHINYLKIDTEGSDLEVLKGANHMLCAHQIDLVEVEAGMNRGNEWHVPFEALKEFLESRKYFLVGIYEQVNEWPTGEQHLRRSNLVFASNAVIQNHRNP